MRAITAIADHWLAQRGHLFPWVPVCFGVGIACYFAAPVEPNLGDLWWAGLGGLVVCVLARWAGLFLGPLLLMIGFIAIGYGVAGARAHWVAAPVLSGHYYGPIEGRVVGLDRSASGALRVTLDQVVLDRWPRPERVRVSLHGEQRWLAPAAGQTIMMTGHLSPPSGPVEPGGFDFQRHAWFQGLGAVGYTRTQVLLLAPNAGGQRILGVRMALSAQIQSIVPGAAGGVAAALLAGDRSALDPAVVDALRASNLAHLLAISGLHMGLLAGVVFGAVRGGLALIPRLALRWPVKKIAALAGLIAGAGYLVLSGGGVATQRAYIMVAVALVAVLADRRAFSLRSVALAALIVLVLRPDALTGPGFQMSFAATAALVAVFEAARGRINGPRWWRALAAVILSSLVAGLATAPFAALHFNRIAAFGLIANLAATPLMGALVIPAGVAGLFLMPFGLGALGLRVMGYGIDWILFVAAKVASWPHAVRYVPAPPDIVLPLLCGGALVLILWQGWGRWSGALALIAAFVFWAGGVRPMVLVSDDGRLVGVMTPAGRAISQPKGAGFVAGVWLENDGDGVDQAASAARAAWRVDPADLPRSRRAAPRQQATIAGMTIIHLRGKTGIARGAPCHAGGWIITDQDMEREKSDLANAEQSKSGRIKTVGAGAKGEKPAVVQAAQTNTEQTNAAQTNTMAPGHAHPNTVQSDIGGCIITDAAALAESGSLALIKGPDGTPQIVSARDRAGARLWNTPALRAENRMPAKSAAPVSAAQ